MTRVATIPLQSILSAGIQRAQQALTVSQQQLASGKKAPDYASLGSDGVRTLSAHAMLTRQKAETVVAGQAKTTLAIQDTSLTAIDTAATSLRQQILSAIGTGQSSGLQGTIEGAFQEYRTALNTSEGGIAVFGGSQGDTDPFVPARLSDLTATDADTAFRNDERRTTARVAEGTDLTIGIVATDIGPGLFEAFKTLAGAGTIGTTLTDAQKTALSTAVGQLDTGLGQLRDTNAENGRKQAQVEALDARADARNTLMEGIISDNEDADLTQVAIDLAQRKTALQASYSVFSQLSQLNLLAYLR